MDFAVCTHGAHSWRTVCERSWIGMKQEERAMTKEQRNMELMQTLDDAWNSQDWDTFDKRHQNDVVVRRPGQPPTHGRHDHRAEGILMFKTFPDNKSLEPTR
jgi:hypothetical protein